jgi:hypothetical protein
MGVGEEMQRLVAVMETLPLRERRRLGLVVREKNPWEMERAR